MPGSEERSFAELLAAIAAPTPAPGGGSSAAWAGAIAAALVEMVAGIAGHPTVAQRAAELRAELLAAAQRDLTSYAPVLEALRLPDADPERSRHLRDALSAASEVPLAIARSAAEVASLAETAAVGGSAAVKGDAGAAVLLAEAATRTAARLVHINLGDREDPRATEAAALADRAAARRAEILA